MSEVQSSAMGPAVAENNSLHNRLVHGGERETGPGEGIAAAMAVSDQTCKSKEAMKTSSDGPRGIDVTRRSSSLGVTLLTEYDSSHRESNAITDSADDVDSPEPPLRAEFGPCLRPGQVFMTNASGEPSSEPPFRPFVGGGAAAAYNALRFDFYAQKQKAAQQKRRLSSLSFGSAKASGGRFASGNNKGGKANPEE